MASATRPKRTPAERKYCSICRHDYRGAYGPHQLTAGHVRALHAGEFRRSQRARINDRRRTSRRLAATTRELERYGFDPSREYPVNAHRRSRPNDGRAKIVKVKCSVRSYRVIPPKLGPKALRRLAYRIKHQRCSL